MDRDNRIRGSHSSNKDTMCGIVGMSGEADRVRLEDGLRAIAHRGPDDWGLFVDEWAGVGLGHRRLAIIDLSPAGHQPMWDAKQQAVIVFNGEIYNFRELRKELLARGYRFESQSDTEMLLNFYLADGEEMLPRLNGMFAFALWDPRHQSLLIARDSLGVKPLYYAVSPRGVAFASEIKGLLPLMLEARELDLQALHRYLSFLWCPGEGTPLKGVRKLLPGEAMVVRDGRIERRWTWYRLPVFRGIRPHLNEQDVIDGTVERVRLAVHRQMVADVPVGAFLSGGLDSSAVVAFAREQNPEIRCFTIDVAGGQEDGTTDDLPYARRVAQHLGVALEVVRVDAERMAGDLERMVGQLDEPLADPAPLNVLYISGLARQHDIKVLLSGAGGDDLFTGYRRHWAVQAERWWRWLPRAIRQGIERLSTSGDQRRSALRRLARLSNGVSLDGDERLASYFLWAREAELMRLYTPEARALLGGTSAAAPLLEFLRPLPENVAPLERMLALEQRFFLGDHNLLYTDKMSMAVGVEVRVPLLDLELVDFAARIPIACKQRGRIGKWVLKKAMERYLPAEVIYRPKTGFGAPLRRWMRHDLRPLVADLLSEASLKRRGLFDPVAVRRLIQANDTGRVDANYTLLSLLCIEIWCRAFVDGNGHGLSSEF
jgi:asparagine synthase (glutamine-hydrolysing)